MHEAFFFVTWEMGGHCQPRYHKRLTMPSLVDKIPHYMVFHKEAWKWEQNMMS